eukprot:11551314-Alexandrium_andersonii.AAC.1
MLSAKIGMLALARGILPVGPNAVWGITPHYRQIDSGYRHGNLMDLATMEYDVEVSGLDARLWARSIVVDLATETGVEPMDVHAAFRESRPLRSERPDARVARGE